jgi:hypothetical protein
MNREIVGINRQSRRRMKELGFTLEPRMRAAMSNGNLNWCKVHRADLTAMQQAKREEYDQKSAEWFGERPPANQSPRLLRDQMDEAIRYRLAQYAFVLAEVILSSGFATKTLNAGFWTAASIGGLLALVAAAVGSALACLWVCHAATKQPLKQKQRVARSLFALGSLWLLVLVMALTVVRTFEGPIGLYLFWAAITAITILSPVCGGLCGVGADLLCWSGRICRDLDAIRRVSRQVELLAAASERGLPPPSGVERTLRPAAAVLLLILIGGSTCRAADIPVHIYVDVSPSARAGDVTQVLKSFAGELSRYEGPDALAVSVIPFYQDAFMATSFVDVRVAGSAAHACLVVPNELVMISKHYANEQRQQCDKVHSDARRLAETSRSAEISKMNAAIDRIAELKLPGRCTAVNALIKRASHERPGGISVVVSDMEDTCPSQDTGVIRPENQTFLVPVGSRQHSIEEGFNGIQERFNRTIPWVQVIEPYRLGVVIDAIFHRK